jgi:hypothetical protein
VVLSEDAEATFLDAMEEEFEPAIRLLIRRAEGDYEPDRRPEKFPEGGATGDPRGRQAVWADRLGSVRALDRWPEARPVHGQPVASCVRQSPRKVGARDAASITAEEAQEWLDGLTTPHRSAHVVKHIWMRGAKTAFKWAADRKRLPATLSKRPRLPCRSGPRSCAREFHEEEWRTILRATLKPAPRAWSRTTPMPAAGSRGCAPTLAHDPAKPASYARRTFDGTATTSGQSTSRPRRGL